jgi:tetratricopeptide (TPR) repeat protein
MRIRRALPALLLLAPLHAGAADSPAAELVREAHAHEAAHEEYVALRRYAEALTLDPTLETAYLGLGALRQRLGDPREAERVYDTALSHLPGLPAALLGRAKARRASGALEEADEDLDAYVRATDDAGALRLLATWYAEEGRTLAELAAWRRLRALAERGNDAPSLREARLTIRALELIAGSADPVRSPPGGDKASSFRRGIARIEKRGGGKGDDHPSR